MRSSMVIPLLIILTLVGIPLAAAALGLIQLASRRTGGWRIAAPLLAAILRPVAWCVGLATHFMRPGRSHLRLVHGGADYVLSAWSA
jgi:hypothetical protein